MSTFDILRPQDFLADREDEVERCIECGHRLEGDDLFADRCDDCQSATRPVAPSRPITVPLLPGTTLRRPMPNGSER